MNDIATSVFVSENNFVVVQNRADKYIMCLFEIHLMNIKTTMDCVHKCEIIRIISAKLQFKQEATI